jgi:hypothetical protein
LVPIIFTIKKKKQSVSGNLITREAFS